MSRFVPFHRFLDATRQARPPSRRRSIAARGRPDFTTEPGQVEFERMRDYILRLYEGVEPPHSYPGADGQPVDCVPIVQQPSFRRLTATERAGALAPPDYVRPEPEPGPGEGQPLGTRRNAIDASDRPVACPEGTIPLRRLTLEQLTRFPTLEQFLQKAPGGGHAPRGAPTGTDPDRRDFGATLPLPEEHRYAHAFQCPASPCVGASTWLNVWKPRPAPGVFSLSQLWITGAGDPGGPAIQTIEGGWQVFPEHYGHDRPVLFLFFTNAGYNPAFGGSRGYNLEVPAFVQTGPGWTIGGPLPSWSVPGGPQRGFRMHWQRDPSTGHWWLFLQGGGAPEPIGFYPRSLFGPGPLATAASRIDFGGEVAARPGLPRTGQMGSGQFAHQGYGAAAFQKEIAFLTPTGPQPAELIAQASHPGLYTIQAGQDGAWKTHVFFGGPGEL